MSVITAASASQSDVQAAIDLAVSGDTVRLPLSGSATWASDVSIPNTKGITVDGNGCTITMNAKIAVSSNALANSRITGFTFTHSSTSAMVQTSGASSSTCVRVDHCTLTTDQGSSVMVNIYDNVPVLFDHCTFNAPLNSEMIHNNGLGAADDSGWYDDITPGGANMVFIEDCTFTNTEMSIVGGDYFFAGNSFIQGYYGCRTVIRYCTINNSQCDMHGGPLGARWWEVYENSFVSGFSGHDVNQDRYCGLRAGSGVVFNNTKSGRTNVGAGNIDLSLQGADSTTYQPGLGKALAIDPAYVWNNSGSMNVTSTAPVVLNTHYFLSAKGSYTPYTYPHPLVSGGGSAGSPVSAAIAAAALFALLITVSLRALWQ